MAFTALFLTTAAAPYTPATLRGAWDDTAGAVTKALASSKTGGGAITSVARAEATATTPYNVLLYRGVSGPLAAQTISGTLDVVLGIQEANADADFYYHVHAYVTQGDSDTPRGTLLTDYLENTTNEWPTTATGKGLQGAQTLSSLGISDGDRLVVEIGYIARNSHSTSRAGTLDYGTLDPTTFAEVADLTASSTSVTTLAGKLVFSSGITELAVEQRVSQLAAEVASEGSNEQRLSQLVVEVATPSGSSAQRLSQLVAEVANNGVRETRISQLVVEVASRPPPNAESSLCGAETPLIYCDLQTAAGPVSWSWVDQPINDALIQRQPRIVNISTLRRELSTDQGGVVVNHGSITLTDDDGVIRDMIAAGTILRKQIDFYGIDDAVRRAGGIPFRLGQYLITEYHRQPDFTVQLSFEDRFGGDSVRDLLTKPLPFRRFDGVFNSTLPIALTGKGQPLPYGELSDEDAGYPTAQVWYTGDRTHPTLGGTWYEGFIAGCATGGPISAWGWDGVTKDLDGNHKQVKLPDSIYDSDIAMPGHGVLWAFWSATPYRVINGQRCTVIYLKAGSSVGEDFKAFATGQSVAPVLDADGVIVTEGVQPVPVHVNLHGIERTGDGRGEVLTSLPEQWQHLLTNFVEQNHNTDANWYDIPLTANTPPYRIIDTASVALVKAQSETRVDGGAPGAFVIGHDLERVTLGDVLHRICLGGDFDMGVNRHGQAFLSMEDATVNPVKSFTVTSVLEGTYHVDRAWDRIANAVTFQTFKNLLQTNASVALRPSSAPPPADWLTGERSYDDGPSIADMGGDPVGRREFVYEDWVTRDTSLIWPNNAAAHKLMRDSRGRVLHQLETDLCGADVELGNNFEITHDAGLVTTTVKVRCTAIEFDPPDPFSRSWAVRLFGYQVGDEVQAAVVTLAVSGGSGGGVFAVGAYVNISADPPPDGFVFSAWAGATVLDSAASSTTIVMPANNVYLRAVFISLSAGVMAGSGTATGAFGGSSTAYAGVFAGAGAAAGAFDGARTVDGMYAEAGATGSLVGRALAAGALVGAGGAAGQWVSSGSGRFSGAGTATGTFVSGSVPGHVTVFWNANAVGDGVLSYVLEWGTRPGIYTGSRDVGLALTYTIPNLVAGTTYYVAVKARNASPTNGGFSGDSSEISQVATT